MPLNNGIYSIVDIPMLVNRKRGTHEKVVPAMARDPHLEEALAVIGRPWTGLILHVLLRGPARFAELGAAVDTITERMLSRRLRELQERGIVKRTVRTGPPVSVVYTLTARGRAVEGSLKRLAEWGARL